MFWRGREKKKVSFLLFYFIGETCKQAYSFIALIIKAACLVSHVEI